MLCPHTANAQCGCWCGTSGVVVEQPFKRQEPCWRSRCGLGLEVCVHLNLFGRVHHTMRPAANGTIFAGLHSTSGNQVAGGESVQGVMAAIPFALSADRALLASPSSILQVKGSFAFVIYDEVQKRVFAARDAEVGTYLVGRAPGCG